MRRSSWATSPASSWISTTRWPTGTPCCDHYFCSVIGPTMPNRITFMSGMVDPTGAHGGPVLETPGFNNSKDAVASVQWDTIPEVLEDKGVSWKIYQQPGTSVGKNIGVSLADGFNVMLYFKQYVNNPNSPCIKRRFCRAGRTTSRPIARAATFPRSVGCCRRSGGPSTRTAPRSPAVLRPPGHLGDPVESRPVVKDGHRPQLRRERRVLRPRRPADAACRYGRRVRHHVAASQ